MLSMKRNIEEADLELTSRPLFSVSSERVEILNEIKSKYKELPQPKRFAKFMSVLLSRVSVPLEEYDLIAGRCVFCELDEDGERMFKEYISSPDYPPRCAMLGSGHCTYSWEEVVSEGLVGLKARTLQSISALGEEESDKKIFLESVVQIYDVISDYMLRYAEAAEARGMSEVAKNLRDGATKRPDSFASALQLLWIIAFIDCAYITANPTLTLGRLDRILYPLYKKDMERGVLTREGAKELITDYYCKHNLIMGRGEHQVGDETNSTTFERILNFDAPQYLLLCGSDKNGECVANELSELFAECIVPSFKNPVVVVRYVKDMDKTHPKLWRTLCDKALDSSALMFYNDANVISTLERIGLGREDACEYAHYGCNWCSTGDNGAWVAGGPGASNFFYDLPASERRAIRYEYQRTNAEHGLAEDLMISLRELYARDGESATIDSLYEIFLARLSDFIDKKLARVSREVNLRRQRPSAILTFGDCFYTDSIESGKCFAANAKYHFEIQSIQMFGTIVDCLVAIDQLVIRQKSVTLGELIRAADADFEGYEEILALCRGAEKYGMDTELSNYHAKRLAESVAGLVIEKDRPYFEREKLFLMPSIQSDTWHLKYGEQYGATVDGRRANKAFSQNTDPSHGAAVNGLTAMLNSVRSIPSDCAVSGALNVSVDKKQFKGDGGHALFASLMATYFELGGLHAQVSAVDAEDLRAAQLDPDAHRDIRVRITGYSGIFVDVCKRLQDDIIERFD
ncbi:MAG: hypothetical protein E7642_01475 [Ruminococcaceae bacterium]|nr:hypothetical protein [Oscillospiraceae bacterium]